MNADYLSVRRRFLDFDRNGRTCGPFSEKTGVLARDPRGLVVAVPAGFQPARGRRTRICSTPARIQVEESRVREECRYVPPDWDDDRTLGRRSTFGKFWRRLWPQRSPWRPVRIERDAGTFTVEVEELDPPDTWFDSDAVVQPDVCQGDLLTVHTKWLAMLPGVHEFEVLFDGEPYEHLQAIPTETLPLGIHQFDFRAVFDDGEERSCAWAFSLVSKVELRAVAPQTELVLGDPAEPNGLTLPLLAVNRAPHPVLVELAVAGVPPGWSAVVLGDALVTLKPEEVREVTLQVELMNDSGLDDRPLPFTVGATSLLPVERPGEQPHALSSFATCYVSVQADPEVFTSAAVLQHFLRVEGNPILYGRRTKG